MPGSPRWYAAQATRLWRGAIKKAMLPKAPVRRRRVSIALEEALLQDVDELATLLGGATDRAYVIEQAPHSTIAEHKAFPQWRSQRNKTDA